MKSVIFNGQAVIPSKVVCIGRNYRSHIAELNNDVPSQAVIFNKPNSAISSSMQGLPLDDLHYEAEISFLVQDQQLLGVGFGLDLTKRELQSQLKSQALPWERAKAFNDSAVFSDFVHCPQDINGLSLKLFIDDELIQQGDVTQMLFAPVDVLQEVSEFMSFEDNDLFMSGTPHGVGRVKAGQRFKGQIWHHDKLLVEQTWQVYD